MRHDFRDADRLTLMADEPTRDRQILPQRQKGKVSLLTVAGWFFRLFRFSSEDYITEDVNYTSCFVTFQKTKLSDGPF